MMESCKCSHCGVKIRAPTRSIYAYCAKHKTERQRARRVTGVGFFLHRAKHRAGRGMLWEEQFQSFNWDRT